MLESSAQLRVLVPMPPSVPQFPHSLRWEWHLCRASCSQESQEKGLMAEPCSSMGSKFDLQGLSWARGPEALLRHRDGFQKFSPLLVVAAPIRPAAYMGKCPKSPPWLIVAPSRLLDWESTRSSWMLVGAGQIGKAVGLGRLMRGQQSLRRAWGPTSLLTVPGLMGGHEEGRKGQGAEVTNPL